MQPDELYDKARADFASIPEHHRAAAVLWCRLVMEPAESGDFPTADTYALKHRFADTVLTAANGGRHGGGYLTDGQMQGVMLAAGFTPANLDPKYAWTFNVQPRCRHRADPCKGPKNAWGQRQPNPRACPMARSETDYERGWVLCQATPDEIARLAELFALAARQSEATPRITRMRSSAAREE